MAGVIVKKLAAWIYVSIPTACKVMKRPIAWAVATAGHLDVIKQVGSITTIFGIVRRLDGDLEISEATAGAEILAGAEFIKFEWQPRARRNLGQARDLGSIVVSRSSIDMQADDDAGQSKI
jgi:hypothetical protein